MRYHFYLCALLFGLAACGGVQDRQEEAIQELSKKWDQATLEVTEAVNRVAEAQEAANEMAQQLAEAKNLSSQAREQFNTLEQNLRTQSETLAELSQEAFEFVNRWQEGADRLNLLKEGVKEGELPSNTQSTIEDLQAMIETGQARAKEWTRAAMEAEMVVVDAQDAYDSFSTSQ